MQHLVSTGGSTCAAWTVCVCVPSLPDTGKELVKKRSSHLYIFTARVNPRQSVQLPSRQLSVFFFCLFFLILAALRQYIHVAQSARRWVCTKCSTPSISTFTSEIISLHSCTYRWKILYRKRSVATAGGELCIPFASSALFVFLLSSFFSAVEIRRPFLCLSFWMQYLNRPFILFPF